MMNRFKRMPTWFPFLTAPTPILRRFASYSSPPASGEGGPSFKAENALTLRPNQMNAVQSVLDELRMGHNTRLAISMPTGGGKTLILAALLEEIPTIPFKDSRIPVADQVLYFERDYGANVQGVSIAVSKSQREQGSDHHAGGKAMVTIAMIQSLSNVAKLRKYDPSRFKVVIIDEAHHAAAESYVKVLQHFDRRVGSLNRNPIDMCLDALPFHSMRPASPASTALPVGLPTDYHVPAIIGATATFFRADNYALGRVFQKVVFHESVVNMIRRGELSMIACGRIKLAESVDPKQVTSVGGDYTVNELNAALNTEIINKMTIQAYVEKSVGRKSTLVFAIQNRHVIALQEAFAKVGIEAQYVLGTTSKLDRHSILENFKARRFPVLINCKVLTEGVDIPNVDCILLARPTMSRTLLTQMVGRGLRVSPEKTDCLIIDIVGDTTLHALSVKSIFGVHPDVIRDDETLNWFKKGRGQKRRKKPRLSPRAAAFVTLPDDAVKTTFHEYDNLFEWMVDSNGYRLSATGLSTFAWVGIGKESFILPSVQAGNFHKIEMIPGPGPALFRATAHIASDSFVSTRVMAEATDFALLFSKVDAQIRLELDGSSHLERRAEWRGMTMTPDQREAIYTSLALPSSHHHNNDQASTDKRIKRSKLDGMWIGRPSGMRVRLSELDCGEAADVLTRLAHGGLDRMKEYQEKMWVEEAEETARRFEVDEIRRRAGGDEEWNNNDQTEVRDGLWKGD